jgi:hypothetical protein
LLIRSPALRQRMWIRTELINILEFAFGLDPQSFDPNPVQFSIEGDNLVLTYRRDRNAGGPYFSCSGKR